MQSTIEDTSKVSKSRKQAVSIKNLLVACNAQTIEEAYQKSTWKKEVSGEHLEMTKCHLCGTPHIYFVVARNLENGVRLTVGTNCYEKLIRFSIFGDFDPLPYEPATVTSIKKSYKILLSYGKTVIGWLDEQTLPLNLRRELEYIKLFGMPSSIESNEALIHYYKHGRILTVEELFNFQQICKASRMEIKLYNMTIAASETIIEILNMFNESQIEFGKYLGLNMSTLNKTHAQENLNLVKEFKGNTFEIQIRRLKVGKITKETIELLNRKIQIPSRFFDSGRELGMNMDTQSKEEFEEIAGKLQFINYRMIKILEVLKIDAKKASADELKYIYEDSRSIYFKSETELRTASNNNRLEQLKLLNFKTDQEKAYPIPLEIFLKSGSIGQKELLKKFKDDLPEIFSLDSAVGEKYSLPGSKIIENIFQAACIQAGNHRDEYGKKQVAEFTEALKNQEKMKVEASPFDDTYVLKVRDNEGRTHQCVISQESVLSDDLITAYLHTVPKTMEVNYDKITESLLLSPEQTKAWRTKALNFMKNEALRIAGMFKSSDVAFDCKIIFKASFLLKVEELGIWINTKNLKLERTEKSLSSDYVYHKAQLTLKVPRDEIGFIIGKKGANIQQIQDILGQYFKVRYLRINVEAYL